MSVIESIEAVQILDSRGNPTVSVRLKTSCGVVGQAAVPSGASTGEHEAIELRDKDPNFFRGKGVLKAVGNIRESLQDLLIGQPVLEQEKLDHLMIQADKTENKERFGANAILGVSLAIAHAAAQVVKMPLYRYLGGVHSHVLPCPMMNIINGGAHADSSLDIQEFMIRPIGAQNFSEAVRWGSDIFHYLKGLLKKDGYNTAVGDEGGFAPSFESEKQAMDYIMRAIEGAGYRPGDQITLALDCAASEFYDAKTGCYIEKKKKQQGEEYCSRTAEEQVALLEKYCKQYPIDSIEDPLDENDWEGWKHATDRLGKHIQIVGDDLFVTNPKFLQKGIDEGIANSILIKPNQIGTLTEALETIRMAHCHGYTCVISHRSGETEDTTIADIAVAMNCGQIKTGSMSRTDRIAKYNRLLWIERELKETALFRDSNPHFPLSKEKMPKTVSLS